MRALFVVGGFACLALGGFMFERYWGREMGLGVAALVLAAVLLRIGLRIHPDDDD